MAGNPIAVIDLTTTSGVNDSALYVSDFVYIKSHCR